MKKIIFLMIIVSLLLNPCFQAEAQISTDFPTTTTTGSSGIPQWARDLRRWDIITFGLFPFSMFLVTTVTDTIRWYNATGMSFDAEGFRYAPWPFKSAGAIEMTNDEYTRTILLAFGISMTAALIDLIIVKIKRSNERRRIENMPSGNYEIEREPYGEPQEPANPGEPGL